MLNIITLYICIHKHTCILDESYGFAHFFFLISDIATHLAFFISNVNRYTIHFCLSCRIKKLISCIMNFLIVVQSKSEKRVLPCFLVRDGVLQIKPLGIPVTTFVCILLDAVAGIGTTICLNFAMLESSSTIFPSP
jgi:hypothetical protein